MAGTKPNEPCLLEDSYKLDIVFGEDRKRRLDGVVGLDRSSMANECPEVDIVSAQRIVDLNIQHFLYHALRVQLFSSRAPRQQVSVVSEAFKHRL
jgi:hypothetical protein